MLDRNTAVIPGADASLDDIDALLEGLEVEASEEEVSAVETIEEPEVVEEVEAAAADEPTELGEDEVAALEAAIVQQEAYEEQAASSDVDTDVQPAAPAAAAAPKTAKAPKAPRQPRDVTTVAADNFVLTSDVPDDLEDNKAKVLATRPAQKKIAEKFDNLFLSLAAGKAPSVYTMIAFGALWEKKSITSTELVKVIANTKKPNGDVYGEGTARSQAGQLMALFDILKIATRSKQTLTINEDSMIALALADMIGAGAEEEEEVA